MPDENSTPTKEQPIGYIIIPFYSFDGPAEEALNEQYIENEEDNQFFKDIEGKTWNELTPELKRKCLDWMFADFLCDGTDNDIKRYVKLPEDSLRTKMIARLAEMKEDFNALCAKEERCNQQGSDEKMTCEEYDVLEQLSGSINEFKELLGITE